MAPSRELEPLARHGDAVLKVYTAAEGELLQESEMRSMCYGFGWVAHADLPAELSDGTELRVVVTHDGGDLNRRPARTGMMGVSA